MLYVYNYIWQVDEDFLLLFSSKAESFMARWETEAPGLLQRAQLDCKGSSAVRLLTELHHGVDASDTETAHSSSAGRNCHLKKLIKSYFQLFNSRKLWHWIIIVEEKAITVLMLLPALLPPRPVTTTNWKENGSPAFKRAGRLSLTCRSLTQIFLHR